jgi:hypothetical protein
MAQMVLPRCEIILVILLLQILKSSPYQQLFLLCV